MVGWLYIVHLDSARVGGDRRWTGASSGFLESQVHGSDTSIAGFSDFSMSDSEGNGTESSLLALSEASTWQSSNFRMLFVPRPGSHPPRTQGF